VPTRRDEEVHVDDVEPREEIQTVRRRPRRRQPSCPEPAFTADPGGTPRNRSEHGRRRHRHVSRAGEHGRCRHVSRAGEHGRCRHVSRAGERVGFPVQRRRLRRVQRPVRSHERAGRGTQRFMDSRLNLNCNRTLMTHSYVIYTKKKQSPRIRVHSNKMHVPFVRYSCVQLTIG